MKIQRSGKPLCRFSYTHQGKTLYYDITSDSTVKVTYYSSVATSNNYVNGDVIIPSFVEYNGTMYSVTSIGERAFRGCSGLTSVTIPNSVTSIGELAFYYCSGLTSVTIPNSVTSIGEVAFSDCSGLTSVTIPNSVTSIGESAFSGCSGLTSVTIPNSVTSIGERAFYGCSGLTSVTIPNSVTSIGGGAFEDCSGLTSINVASGNTHYSSIDGVLYNYVQDTLMQCPGAKTSVTIPNRVTSIGGRAFYGCSGLTSVTIGTGVTSIGDYAFSGCSGLTTLNFNAIDCQNFSGYSSPFGGPLTTVNIGDSVQRIPAYFVGNCSGLTSVTIPNSVTSIGEYAFSGCSGLTSVRCLAVTPPSIDNTSFYNLPSTCTLTIPFGSIGAYTGSDWDKYFAERISEE